VYPDVSLKDARDHRDEARKLLANGVNPGENRKAQKSARADGMANSFEVVAREWFAKHSPTWAANHGRGILSRCYSSALKASLRSAAATIAILTNSSTQ
jgi:Arm DNA-binding domain